MARAAAITGAPEPAATPSTWMASATRSSLSRNSRCCRETQASEDHPAPEGGPRLASRSRRCDLGRPGPLLRPCPAPGPYGNRLRLSPRERAARASPAAVRKSFSALENPPHQRRDASRSASGAGFFSPGFRKRRSGDKLSEMSCANELCRLPLNLARLTSALAPHPRARSGQCPMTPTALGSVTERLSWRVSG